MPFLIILLLVAVPLIAAGPLIILWALNTLFGLGIPYTFWTWLATAILTSVIKIQVKKD